MFVDEYSEDDCGVVDLIMNKNNYIIVNDNNKTKNFVKDTSNILPC